MIFQSDTIKAHGRRSFMLRAGAYYDKKEYEKVGRMFERKITWIRSGYHALGNNYGFKGYEFFEKLKRDSRR